MSDTDLYRRLLALLETDESRVYGLRSAVLVAISHHEPTHLHAGVKASMFGDGKCAYCHSGEPAAVFRDYLNGSIDKVEMHCHGFGNWCEQCPSELSLDENDEFFYPCRPLAEIIAALGVRP